MKRITALIAFTLIVLCCRSQQTKQADSLRQRQIADSMRQLTERDHRAMMALLHIDSLRPGANGNNPNAPNAANYDESKANPYPNLPDPLVLKNGKKVTTVKMWWEKRRAEIVEDFDREIYGRVPANTPKVNWEVISTTNEINGDVAVITKKLVGHVDNSSYPQITVDIQLTLTTPANATHAEKFLLLWNSVLSFPPDSDFLHHLVIHQILREHHRLQPGSNRFSQKVGAML